MTLTLPPGTKTYPKLPGCPPSVTSILSVVWPSPELQKWKIAQAAKKGAGWDDRSAANRGTRVHKYAECRALDRPLPRPASLQDEQFFHAFERFVLENVESFVCAEMPVWNEKEGYAGTLDCSAVLKPGPVLAHGGMAKLDWKTVAAAGKGWYPDNAIQLAAYDLCSQALVAGQIVETPPADHLVIVRLTPDATYESRIVHRERATVAWRGCLGQFRRYCEKEAVWDATSQRG